MYASTRRRLPIATMASARHRRVWVRTHCKLLSLALACNETDPLRPDALIDDGPCLDCGHKNCARTLIIKRILALKRYGRHRAHHPIGLYESPKASRSFGLSRRWPSALKFGRSGFESASCLRDRIYAPSRAR